jgi:hypothetical protein
MFSLRELFRERTPKAREDVRRKSRAWCNLERTLVAGTTVVIASNDACTCFCFGYGIGAVSHLAGFREMHEIESLIREAISYGRIPTISQGQVEEGVSEVDQADALALLGTTVQRNRGPVELSYERDIAQFTVRTKKEPEGVGGRGSSLCAALHNAFTHPWF